MKTPATAGIRREPVRRATARRCEVLRLRRCSRSHSGRIPALPKPPTEHRSPPHAQFCGPAPTSHLRRARSRAAGHLGRPSTPGSAATSGSWLWSRRSRVRVPSLTSKRRPACKAGFRPFGPRCGPPGEGANRGLSPIPSPKPSRALWPDCRRVVVGAREVPQTRGLP
jgi:hypothetical protein